MCVSIRGQLAILSADILDKIIALVKDPMPNVAAAATECLCKVSSLFIGASALESNGMMLFMIDPCIHVMMCRCDPSACCCHCFW